MGYFDPLEDPLLESPRAKPWVIFALIGLLICAFALFAEEGGAPKPHPFIETLQAGADQERLDRLAAFHKITPGMAPLEVASLLGMDCTVEVSNPAVTLTWWQNGDWMAVVFIDLKAVSKQKGSTKATGSPP